MSDFFNNYLNIPKIMREKREYKAQMARVDALPEDYRFLFKKIQSHMWTFAAGDGLDMMRIHYDLIDLFEDGAAAGKDALEVTGEDAATFCEELLKNARTYAEDRRVRLNREIIEKLGKERSK
jgi:DNA-binding ferritin-like protein (Dps family)